MTRRARWIRHWRLVALFALVLLAVVAVFGTSRISALTSSERSLAVPPDEGLDIQGTVDLYDDSVVHELALEYRQAAYRRMIATYKSDGRKVFIPAALTIDGVRLAQVGIRLKGNSTLRGLRDRDGGGFRGPGGALSPGEPERLPWLISIDEYVDGRSYQGFETLTVRAGTKGGMAGESGLNEAVALRLLDRAGQPAERFAFATLAVNGKAPVLRLLVEDPGRPFAEARFEHEGVLYKALSTGSFSFEGDDPLAYEDAFKQVTRKKRQDLRPLIDLLRWVGHSSDRAFAAGLAKRVDVQAFAAYAALQEILENFDDMAGPGQNYYLWYDLEDERFTPVTWDLNLALGSFPGRGPGGFSGNPGGFGPRGGNLLKERFLAVPRYERLARETEADLRAKLLGKVALGELSRLRAIAATSDAVDEATLATEFEQLRERLAVAGS
jgi:spore coat protein CotH